MAASNGSSTGRKNYYNVSYGKLSTKSKDAPEGFTEIAEADLKSKTQAVESIDLRRRFINKGTGERPFQVFYDSLTGVIEAFEKHENDNGINLNLTVLDEDGDTSILQVKFYSKYAENLLNRLLNTPTDKTFTFFPYAIANTAEINGEKRSFYTQGVSLKADGVKIEGKYKNDDAELPPTEQVKVQGKATTSRDKRLDFLFEEFSKVFTPGASNMTEQDPHLGTTPKTPKPATPQEAFESAPQSSAKSLSNDDLPF